MKSLMKLMGEYAVGSPEPLYYFRSIDTNVLVRLARDDDKQVGDLIERARREAESIKCGITKMAGVDAKLVTTSVLTASEFIAAMREAHSAETGTPRWAFQHLLKDPYTVVLDSEVAIKGRSNGDCVLVDWYDHGKLAYQGITLNWANGHGSVIELMGVLSGAPTREANLAGAYFIADKLVHYGHRRRVIVAGIDSENREYVSVERSPAAFADMNLVIPVAIKMADSITRNE